MKKQCRVCGDPVAKLIPTIGKHIGYFEGDEPIHPDEGGTFVFGEIDVCLGHMFLFERMVQVANSPATGELSVGHWTRVGGRDKNGHPFYGDIFTPIGMTETEAADHYYPHNQSVAGMGNNEALDEFHGSVNAILHFTEEKLTEVRCWMRRQEKDIPDSLLKQFGLKEIEFEYASKRGEERGRIIIRSDSAIDVVAHVGHWEKWQYFPIGHPGWQKKLFRYLSHVAVNHREVMNSLCRKLNFMSCNDFENEEFLDLIDVDELEICPGWMVDGDEDGYGWAGKEVGEVKCWRCNK